MRKEGEEFASKVKSFQKEHSRLPYSIDEVPITKPLNPRLCYDTLNSTDFMVWYGTTLGESCTYHSSTKAWDATNNRY